MKESGTYIMLYEQVKIQGKKISEVSRMTGMSRNTIKKYLREGEKAHKATGRKKQSKLDPYKTAIQELMRIGIYNANTILERIRKMGYDGGITILKDYLSPLRPPALRFETAVRRYETKPGKQAQMDWGILKYKDKKGRICKIACFVMILGYSRMRYVEFSRRCDEASLLRCMVNAFEYFNGVPDTVLTDRMKTVVISSDHGRPVWQETFERFAAEVARDCFISFNGVRYGVNWNYCGQAVKVRQKGDKLTIVSSDGDILYIHDVCHQSRKHVWAKGQYDGLEIHEGRPYEAPYGLQVLIDDVEIRPLIEYENLVGVI